MHTDDVLSVVSQWSIDGFFNSLLRCEMDNAFRTVAMQGLHDQRSVQEHVSSRVDFG